MIEEIKKVGKPYVFRYRRDNDFTLQEIKDSYIYFQKRGLLNDPFDSIPDLVDLKCIHIDNLHKAFEKLVGKQKTEFIVKKISRKRLEETVRNSIPKFINKRGIACFSMLPGVNMPLLANYANR